MGNARELFLTNKDDTKAVYAITTSDAFEKLCVFSMSEFAETSGANAEQMAGARHILSIMRKFADPDEEEVGLITSGINHDLSVPDKELPAAKAKKKK